jgi:hydrogenase maturation protease
MLIGKRLVIGLGNPILTDDAVGILVVREVKRLLPRQSKIDVVELAVGGLTLMEAMIDCDQVVLVDALWLPDTQSGEVIGFSAEALPDTFLNTANAHDADLKTALQVGAALGASLPDLSKIQIVGVTVEKVLDFGESPTPRVTAAIPHAVSEVMSLLGY